MTTTATITDAIYQALVFSPHRLQGDEPELQHLLDLHAPEYRIARDGASWKLSGWQNCAEWIQHLERLLRKTNCWNLWCGYEINEWSWISLSPFGLEGLSTRDYNLLFLRNVLYVRRRQTLFDMVKQSIISELHPAMKIDINAPLADHQLIQKQVFKILFYSLEYSRLYEDPNAGGEPGVRESIPRVLGRLYKLADISQHRDNIYLPTREGESIDQVCAMARQIREEFLTHTDLDSYIALNQMRMLQRAAEA